MQSAVLSARKIDYELAIFGSDNRPSRVKQGKEISPTCNRAFCVPRHSAGGAGGSRTPVRKPIHSSFYTLSRSFKSPLGLSERQDSPQAVL